MYTKEQLEEIIFLYEPCKRNAAEAARRASFDISRPTILKYWRMYGLKPAPKGGKRECRFFVSDEEHDRIIREYERCRDVATVVGIIGRSRQTICNHLRREGIEIERREKAVRKDKRIYKEDVERPVFTRYKAHFPIR